MGFSVVCLSLCLIVLLPVGHGATVPGTAVNNTLTLAFLIPWSRDWSLGPTSGSALPLGIQEVYNRQLLPGYTIEYVVRDSWCNANQGFKMLIDMWQEVEDLDALIGGGCSVVCQPTSLMTAAWNIPSVSFSCTSGTLTDKEIFPTFTRAVGTWLGFAPMFDKFMDVFGWTRVGIITATQDIWQSTANAVKDLLENRGKTVIYNAIESTVNSDQINQPALDKAQEVVQSMKNLARIIYLFTYGSDVHNLLVLAYEEGMLNGEYVFVSMDSVLSPFEFYSYRSELYDHLWNGFITMDPLKPSGPAYEAFAQDLIDAFQDPIWDDWDHLPANASIDDVNAYAGFVYDAVLQWAYGVNRTLEAGGAVDDGLAIADSIFNMSFHGITGMLTLDQYGDRKTDQSIQIFQNGQMVPLLTWWAAAEVMEETYSNYSWAGWDGIIWAGGSTVLPSDSPPCGWDGELCSDDGGLGTGELAGLGTAGAVVLLSIIVGVYSFRRYTLNKMAAKACQITWAEVKRVRQGFNKSVASLKSTTSVRSIHNSQPDVRARKESIFVNITDSKQECEIATYGDNPAMLHKSAKFGENMRDSVLSRALSRLSSVSHENLLHFMGVIFDAPEKCVLTDIAARGTLTNMLQSGEMVISQDFKLSLLSDIANGMKYLHQSPVGIHQSLTSNCCLIDSKWVCKISNYWNDSLINILPTKDMPAEDLLWTAPEILRGLQANNKCDVYSYGIIVQEVVMEDKPYSGNIPALEPEEIVQRVTGQMSNPYRPHIPDNTCSQDWFDLASRCWDEEPNVRPSFHQVLSLITALNGGRKVNLVDSMAARLEAHTRRLEEIVEERSQELADQKIRAEMLVCELLPKSVYYQLKAGETVEPETFEIISMFFSDIVGFTKISACAQPMDIVNLLNGLYSVFDDILMKFDVYKMATIGDAYIVASGLPERNGDRHAGEIAGLAIELLDSIEGMEIGHMPGKFLQMRIGLHTGSCVGAVTGTKMPRYLLFGDTVNTGARIEAAGEAMRIHMSDTITVYLKDDPRFIVIPREEEQDIPGHGKMKTSWLIGYNKDYEKDIQVQELE